MIHKGEKTQYIEKWCMREAFNSKDEFGTQVYWLYWCKSTNTDAAAQH